MNERAKITASHHSRQAIVYLRQSIRRSKATCKTFDDYPGGLSRSLKSSLKQPMRSKRKSWSSWGWRGPAKA